MIEKKYAQFNRHDYITLFYDTEQAKYILFVNGKKTIISNSENPKKQEGEK